MQHEALFANSLPYTVSVAGQPFSALDSAPHATSQTATHPACCFSVTKLTSSGIVMLQLLPHASKQGAHTDTDNQWLPGTNTPNRDTDPDSQLLPGTSKQGTDTDRQLLPGTSKQGTDIDKQLMPGNSKQGTDTDTERQLLSGTSQAGTDTDKELVEGTSTSDKDSTKHLLLPGTIKQGTDAVNSAYIAPVDHVAEVPGHAVTETGLVLPSHLPRVQRILDDLQAGKLTPSQKVSALILSSGLNCTQSLAVCTSIASDALHYDILELFLRQLLLSHCAQPATANHTTHATSVWAFTINMQQCSIIVHSSLHAHVSHKCVIHMCLLRCL